MRIKYITQGAMLASLAAIVQLIPIFTSNFMIPLTILSTLPIYFSSRSSIKVGIISYTVTAMMIMMFSLDAAIVFLFTNGLVGLVLAVTETKFNHRGMTTCLSSVTLTSGLIIGKYIIGWSILWVSFDTIMLELLFLLILATVYITILNSVLIVLEKQFKHIIK